MLDSSLKESISLRASLLEVTHLSFLLLLMLLSVEFGAGGALRGQWSAATVPKVALHRGVAEATYSLQLLVAHTAIKRVLEVVIGCLLHHLGVLQALDEL